VQCWKKVATGAAALLLFSCHEAPRKNPFDPVLTPAVELVEAALDEGEGVVRLEWTQYAGQQPFAGYRVLRKVRGLEAVDTLAFIEEAALTRFADASIEPDTDYLYWIAVVNQAGFEVASAQVPVGSFSVEGIDLLEALGNGFAGTISLRWEQYRGPGFEGYEVWRRSFGSESRRLDVVGQAADTAWADTSARPETDYLYWVALLAAGKRLESQQREGSYRLPAVELRQAAFSSQTASALLEWTPYQGPRFAAYEVRRKSAGQDERAVAVVEEVGSTRYLDTVLDGNTEYAYRLFVRTAWGAETGVFSQEKSGKFYALEEMRSLPASSQEEVQALALAMDEEDRLYAAATMISTTTARVMNPGVRLLFPGQTQYRRYFSGVVPHRLSPIHLAVRQGVVYAAVSAQGGGILVGAVEAEGDRRERWSAIVQAGEELPSGLLALENGELLVVDQKGTVYSFGQEGEALSPDDELRKTLENDQAQPLRHVVVGPGAGLGGLDAVYLLSPERDLNHVLVRMRTPLGAKYIYGGKSFSIDDGVGPENGETLNPLALAFDAAHTRLVVLEAQGRLQVLNAVAEEVERRYLTKWGRFGAGEGEFLASPPISVALAVDSSGRVYVADGEERVQVFAP
jgi:hypothetical protein